MSCAGGSPPSTDVAAPDLWRRSSGGRCPRRRAVDAPCRACPARLANRDGASVQAPAFGGRPTLVLLILVAALIAVLVGALIAGSAGPDVIRTVVVPSLAVPAPAPTAASLPPPRTGAGTWTAAAPAGEGLSPGGDRPRRWHGARHGWPRRRHERQPLPGARGAVRRWHRHLDAGRVDGVGPGRVHTATRLSDGRVLVAGGFDDWAALATARCYEPGTGIWTPTGSMVEAAGLPHGDAPAGRQGALASRAGRATTAAPATPSRRRSSSTPRRGYGRRRRA